MSLSYISTYRIECIAMIYVICYQHHHYHCPPLMARHSLSLTVTHCPSLSLTVTHCLSLSLTVPHCHSLSLTVSHCHSLSLTVTHSHSLSLTVTQRHSLSLTLTHCHLTGTASAPSTTAKRSMKWQNTTSDEPWESTLSPRCCGATLAWLCIRRKMTRRVSRPWIYWCKRVKWILRIHRCHKFFPLYSSILFFYSFILIISFILPFIRLLFSFSDPPPPLSSSSTQVLIHDSQLFPHLSPLNLR